MLLANDAGDCEAIARDTEHPANVFGTEEARGTKAYLDTVCSPGYGQDAELLVQNLQPSCCR